MSTWAKYQLDRRRLRQAKKAIPDVTWKLSLGYCQNLGELVLSEGRNYKLFFVLLEANPILPKAPRDVCGQLINEWMTRLFKEQPLASPGSAKHTFLLTYGTVVTVVTVVTVRTVMTVVTVVTVVTNNFVTNILWLKLFD